MAGTCDSNFKNRTKALSPSLSLSFSLFRALWRQCIQEHRVRRYYANIISNVSRPSSHPGYTGFLRRWGASKRTGCGVTRMCIHVTRVCGGIRAPAPHQVFGLSLRDVICEVYRHRGVEGHAVKGILVGPWHDEGAADQPNPTARLHRGISFSIPIPDPLNRMDWLASRRIDSPSEPEDSPHSVTELV